VDLLGGDAAAASESPEAGGGGGPIDGSRDGGPWGHPSKRGVPHPARGHGAPPPGQGHCQARGVGPSP